MRRFYLAVPLECEEDVIKKIGELGVAQLTREIMVDRPEKSEMTEACRAFLKLYERIDSALVKEAEAKKQPKGLTGEIVKLGLDQINSLLDQNEDKLDDLVKAIKKTETETENLKLMEERLGFLKTYGLRVDEIGSFRHIFVKVGFIRNTLLSKLNAYLIGTSVVHTTQPGRIGESYLVIIGLNEDQSLTETSLELLNFEEFVFPQDLTPEPEAALEEVKNKAELKRKEHLNLKEDLLEMKKQFDVLEPYVSETLQIEEIKNFVVRTSRKALITGWIPSDRSEFFEAQIEKVTQEENIYLRFEEPKPEDQVPVQSKSKGLMGSFQTLTNLRGVPNYFEINPTPIYVVLYTLMFGIMLGDMGDGIIFIILGFLLIRLHRGFLTFSKSTTRKLGQILVSCGLSAVFFGLLYGQLFLVEIIPPILSPISDITEIIIIALAFGVLQMSLALILSVINKIRRQGLLKATFSGYGVIGLTFYLPGVVLAIAFIRERNFNAFLLRDVFPFTLISLVSLALIFFSPTIKMLAERKKVKFSEKILEGFGEGLEIFISLIANSVSYIRLAAFVIAHEALGVAVVIFASVVGGLPSLLILNVISFLVEGFAALIQSMRLMFYEFSTKFYAGDGIPYDPFKIPASKNLSEE